MRANPGVNDWLHLKRFAPKEMYRLIDLCIVLTKLQSIFQRKAIFIGKDVGDYVQLIHRIISEYKGLFKDMVDKETYKKVEQDIHGSLKVFYTKEGKVSNELSKILTEKNVNFEIHLHSNPAVSFINSKVFDALHETLAAWNEKVLKEFVNNTCERAGIMPSFTEEQSLTTKSSPTTHDYYG